MTSKPRRIKITKVHQKDAFYPIQRELVGLTGEFTPELGWCSEPGYFAGRMKFDSRKMGLLPLLFHAIRYVRI